MMKQSQRKKLGRKVTFRKLLFRQSIIRMKKSFAFETKDVLEQSCKREGRNKEHFAVDVTN